MLVHVYGAKCSGIQAVKVTVEMEVLMGIGFHMVGLADAAVRESLLRTSTALDSMGFHVPGRKVVINLAPADMRKSGTGYDLPIAVGIIAASSQGDFPELGRYLIMGELGLDGSVRPIPAALPYAELAKNEGFKACIFPYESARDAAILPGIDIYGVHTLQDVVDILSEDGDCSYLLCKASSQMETDAVKQWNDIPDFADIVGQEGAKRGAEIACAGGHNMLLIGSPGSGKSTIAHAVAGILPPMTHEESLLTSKIYSVASKMGNRGRLITQRPFRAPHCSASLAAMIGGGSQDDAIPGEVSLAHNGVLFLDEVTLVPRSVLDALRAPMEDGKVVISRMKNKVEYPSDFMFIAACNPCPCGFYGEVDRCICTPTQRYSYLKRLSGPLMDRLDLQVWCSRILPSELRAARKAGRNAAESSAVIAARVALARGIQARRFALESISCNAQMSAAQIEKYCQLSAECMEIMDSLMERMKLSMRSYNRIIKVSRTIADLEGSPHICPEHIYEAAGYRLQTAI